MHALLTLLLPILIAMRAVGAEAPQMPDADWKYVRKQMKLAGLSEPFIKEMQKNYESKDFEEVVRLNVLLFLKKADIHGVQVNDQAVVDVQGFMKDYDSRLKKAEAQFEVPGRIVASLLWMESRYGKNLGRFHVPSVYLNLLQAPRADVQNYLLTQTGRYTDKVTAAQKKKIISRTHDKAKFAIGELFALQRAYKYKWKLGPEFRGSFSGAFGMPQFLPSSYVHFARSVDPKAQPQLDGAEDAIMSVAYFLRMHGWRTRQSSTHMKALKAYNNSRDYANAILTLAEKSTAAPTAPVPVPAKQSD
jgi:membrane-bound lytic murein transglycosylase B